MHRNFFSVHVPTLSSVSILFCLLVEKSILPIAYFISCLRALSHALLVADTQNMMIDLSMDGRQTAWNYGVDISKGEQSPSRVGSLVWAMARSKVMGLRQ